ncbi:MAG: type II secretion system F family protein [Pelotomaculum sp.]|uniref:Flp pilus assembly protein TadC n=1 Tax=Pelotomaculum thermopropionicum (strain DSM 13744 / JCM 10971 / SI) TaxID=370438 RepID=A5D291_PELTS|nr:type II secretion system F family protein [Pelotomaculum sp.]BAF59634.1 flp pilus assembly protein TadC [Pelotomaculum thermopropionicum SI]
MLELIAVFIFTEVFLVILLLYNIISKERQEVESRVAKVVGSRTPTLREQELKAPLFQRIIKPLLARLSLFMVKMLPAEKEAELAGKISRAGLSQKITPRELLALKYLAAAGTATTLLITGKIMAGRSLFQIILLGTAGLALGWFVPELLLNKKILDRKKEIEKSLPDVMDLLTVSVEAGLSFDGALMKVTEKKRGVLSEEFTKMLQEIKIGRPRLEALRDLSRRLDVDDLSAFAGAVILADQLGISIGNILRVQSDQIRMKRRQAAEEMAMKAPVKMLIPMVLFIFPAIFVVLLGPAVIQISKAFSN